MRRSFIARVIVGLTIGLSSVVAADETSTVTLDRAVYFTAPDGGDVQIASGDYRIEPAGESQLRLVMTSGGQPIQIAAYKTSHDETLVAPIAMAILEEGQDDPIHLVLILPDHRALDAIGSYSGIHSRAATVSALKPARLQTAVGHVKAASTPTPHQSAAPMTVVRVPQAGVLPSIAPPVRKTVQSRTSDLVSWDFIRMHNPDVIATVIKAVQAGKLDSHILAGVASPVRIAALLRQNYDSLLNAPQPNASRVGNRWAEILSPNISSQLATPRDPGKDDQ